MSLRVGLIDYINVFPLTHFLEQGGAWDLVPGVPSDLNRALRDGTLDVSPVSSIEYARNQDEWKLLPDVSIASPSAVGSVMLFSRLPLDALHGQPLGICNATATSRVLLRVLLEGQQGISPHYEERATFEDVRDGRLPAALLIGDEALALRRAAQESPTRLGLVAHDLGEMWAQRTGLPMVFAVWAVRREHAHTEALSRLAHDLRASHEAGRSLPPSLLARAAARTGMSDDALRAYYSGLHFTLGAQEQRALLTFFEHAAALGLCPPCARLDFALPVPSPSLIGEPT